MTVRGVCRRRDAAWTVTLFLLNEQKEPALNKDEVWLFQPELTVQAPDGAAIFIKRPLPDGPNNSEPEDREM